ncbi:DUF11 domain-containing protein [Microbacterium sp. SSW1-47]|uniref:DUF7507 domain-containing protein n=1 Tax=Microbacterium sufflavum TaxID=2851649 RepID=UPI001FFCDD01|nr:hypothetical protein [Microbacterium sufflavum]MCK2025729.1 DUF11 domain-containing protein [Microbacterium sufflavum]
MFASEHHNFIAPTAGPNETRRRWAIIALLALLASLLVTVVAPPKPAEAQFQFSCTSTEGVGYFVNTGSGSVSMIYTGTDTNIRNIPVGGTPYGVTSLPDGSRVYVANGNGSVQVIDTATLAVTTINHPSFSASVGAWSSADGSQVFISNIGSNTVSVIDTATNTVSRVITVGAAGSRPGWVDAYGNELFVAKDDGTNGGISVIDMSSTSTTTSRVIAGAAPAHTVAVNATYIAAASETVLSIPIRNRTAPSALVRTITTTEQIHGLTFVPNTNYLVASGEAGHTFVYDASTGALLRTFTAGGSNMRVPVASPISNEVYIAGYSTPTGTLDRLVTTGAPATWTYTANQTALQNAPDGHTPAFSCLPPLSGSKSFAKSPIAQGETTTLTITINNTNLAPTTGITGAALTDNLPSNIRIAPTGTATTTCTAATLTAPPGGTTVSLSGASIPAATGPNGAIVPGSCTITVPVIGVTPGAQTNTIEPGALSANIVGETANSFSAPIEVLPPAMQIAKTNDDADGIVDGGQTLTYSITLTNAGTIPQTGVTVDDVLPAGVTYVPGSTVATQGTTVRDNAAGGTNPDLVGGDPVAGSLVGPTDPFTIPPGESLVVTYQVTVDTPAPETIDSYTNTASASSTQEPTPISTTDTVQALSTLDLVKSAGTPVDVNGNGTTDTGDTIAYTFTVTNTGNTTIANIAVTDPKLGAITCDATTLAPDAVATCTAPPYVITQAETDAGAVDNSATAAGTDPSGDPIASNESTTSTPTEQAPALLFDKTAAAPVDVNANGITDAGDTIAYTFSVANTGNVTMSGITVTDPKIGAVTCDVTTLAPGEVASCTAPAYAITAADQDAGEVANTASATGTAPGGTAVPSNDDSTTTPVVAPAPALEIDKTAGTPVDVNGNGSTDVGDTIAYTFTVTNTGNVTVSDIAVNDPKVGTVTCDVTALGPTGVATCTAAPYVITQADMDNGSVDNSATANGTDPTGGPVVTTPDTTTTPTDQAPALSFDKTAGTPVDVNANGITDEGDTIAYTFTVTNTGNVTVAGIAVTDAKVGAVTCDVTTLTPGAVATCTAAPYTITAADETAGEVVNSASAAGTDPGGDAVPSNTDTTTTPVVASAPSLTIDKAAGAPVDVNGNGVTDAGDTIAYTFTVTNTGNVPLADVAVDDPKVGAVTCDATTLAPGAVASCTAATYTITQADVDNGSVDNSATATGTPPGEPAITSDPDTTSTPTDQTASLVLDKTAGTPVDVNADGLTDEGDTIAYTFTVTNTGTVTLTDVAVDDPKVGTVTCDVTTLAPGAVATCTAAPYTITAADETAGEVANTATAAATDPGGDPAPTADDSTTTPVVASAAALTIDKVAGAPVDVDGNGITNAGDTIAYTFTVTNTGNVAVSEITVDDPKVGAVTCDVTTLAPGAVANCTAAPYVITAADETAGEVANTATAAGTDPDGDSVASDPDSTTTPVVTPAPALSFEKTAGTPVDVNANGITDEGDTIGYTFTVTNTGNVTVTDVAVDDPKVGAVTCDVTTLAPGEVASCASAPYTVTAADEAAGEVANTATASGTAPNGDPVPSDPDSTTTPSEASAPSSTIEKTAGAPVDVNGNGVTDVGDTIAYTFTVTNTGNVPLADVTVNDPKVGAVTCDVTTLAPGAVANCTAAPYVITQADVDNGSVDNSATATGTPPGEDPVPSEPDTTTTPTDQTPALELDKVAGTPVDVNGDGLTNAGDTIDYTFTVTNTGNVTLTDVAVADPKVGTVTCDVTTLAPGAVATCTAPAYTVTTDDEAAGEVANTATASATDPAGDPAPTDDDSTTTPAVPAAPALSFEKTAGAPVDVNANGITDEGDTIDYTFTVTNTGNVTLTDITVSDPKAGTVTCDVTTLAPGAVASCSAATYTVTAEDEAAGEVANTATATGTEPGGDPVPSDPDSTTTPSEASAPGVTIDKTAGDPVDVNGNGLTDVGDTIAYSFTVTNTGNVPLADVGVNDPKVGTVTCDVTTLAPGEVATCTAAPYTITQADVDAGGVENSATATGTPPGEDPVPSEPDTIVTPVDQVPSLLFDKVAGAPVDVNANGITDAGDTIDYTFTVTNTGTVTATDIAVSDPKAGAVTCDVTTLAPGEVASCSAATYTVTAADEQAGEVANTATATGTDPNGDSVPSDPDSTTTPSEASAPGVTIDKTAGDPVDVNGNGLTDVGDTIAYSFTITNTGNVPLADVGVNDPKVGTVTCDVTTLAPGEVATCGATYTITQADVDAGSVENSATATGTPPGEDPVPSEPDTVVTPVDQVPSLSFDKVAGAPVDVNANGITDEGDTIDYTFTVTNTGTVTATDIAVSDPKVGTVTCDVTTLAPGEVANCTAPTYTVTADDEQAGEVANTATASGTDPNGDPVPSNPDSTTTPAVASAPSSTIDKTAGAPVDVNGNGLTDVGDTIAYSFTITNTGNVPLADVGVNDPKVGTVTCDVTTLAPGEVATCTAAPYVITQADVDAGGVENSATATGTPPGGDPVPSEPDTVVTPTDQVPSMTLVKTAVIDDADRDRAADEGEVIHYAFTVANTGNVTIENLGIDDPMLDERGDAITCPLVPLAPGEQALCTADHVVTAAEATGGDLTNVATATGRTGTDDPITSDPSTVSTPTDPETPEPARLPTTGGRDQTAAALLALALILGGVTLVVVRRGARRRPTDIG